MESSKIILNVSVGSSNSWYHRGQNRLRESLAAVGSDVDWEFVSRPNPIFSSAYADKVVAIFDAYNKGFEKILWLDCSITAVRSLEDIWKYIDDHGFYFYRTGYNCAQTANDKSLENYLYTRDQAEKVEEIATNVMGFNCLDPRCSDLINLMYQGVVDGSIYGNKWPNPIERLSESRDPRFQFHRQDQTIISLSAGLLKIPITEELNHFVFRNEMEMAMNDSVIFRLKGGD